MNVKLNPHQDKTEAGEDEEKAENTPNLWLHMLQRNPDSPLSRPRSYHPFYVRGGMSYSNSSHHETEAGIHFVSMFLNLGYGSENKICFLKLK